MQTYLFYDIETTGLNKAFDQILHFAGIRTTLDLVEIERYEFKVKLNPDIIPSPKAMMTHQISIAETENGISEYEAIKQIHSVLNQPGTISLGYNTLGFDDEFLRFSFYRNLLPPYTHQYANQCYRMDIYPITVMYFLFKNHLITWPKKNDKISLKLEELNHSNQWVTGRSHHAMVDVEATLNLAMSFLKEREMWEYIIGYFNKQIDSQRLPSSDALMIDGIFGPDQAYQCPVLFLGNHRHYKNQTLWLQLDNPLLVTTHSENIKETTRAYNKKLGEPAFVLPFANRFQAHLKTERLALADSNKNYLKENPELLQKIINYHAEYKHPVFPNTDVEAALYLNGFWNQAEENFCRRFHQVSVTEKVKMTEKFCDSPVKTLASRLLSRHYREIASPIQQKLFADYRQRIHDHENGLTDYRGMKKLTPQLALQEISTLRNEPLDIKQINLLTELENYIQQNF